MGLDFVHIYRVHPKSLKNYRMALYPSGAKDDPTDADLILEFAKHHQDKIQPWVPDDVDSRLLLRLVEGRRKVVNKRGRLTNELTQLLKEYFPQALDWAGKIKCMMACDFLMKWPTLEKLQKSKSETVRQFYRDHGSRNSELINLRIEEIRSALPLTTDKAVVESSIPIMETIVRQLRVLIDAVACFDEEIKAVYQKQPDAEIFASFPGAGPALEPRLLAVMGTDRSRFSCAQEVEEYSGIAPVTERSGKSKWVHRRLACCAFVKQSFHEYAGQTVTYCLWAGAFYESKRAAGKEHHAALRALAYKWIRIIYRCWKDHVPYDEQRYMESLKRRQPAWLAFLPTEA
jgi:transposase